MNDLEPLVIEPRETPAIWGGDALVKVYGKSADPGERIGESWECWEENTVRGGRYAGKTIGQLRITLGKRLMGSLDGARIFPVLTKIIDARQSLSVQVHPNDAYAQRVEAQPNGKTECWVILSAEPGAELVLGWGKPTTRAEYERRVKDGTLGDILRRVPVRANDAFYLPSGTLHAIGAGIQLFETQQASDLTYRIFDWNRVGADGKPRQLHVEKAADVLNYGEGKAAQTTHLSYRLDGMPVETYIADRRFVVERLEISGESTLAPDGVPLIVMAMGEGVVLMHEDSATELGRWTTALLPAQLGPVTTRAAASSAHALLVTPSRDAWLRTIRRAGVQQSVLDAFLSQFEEAPANV